MKIGASLQEGRVWNKAVGATAPWLLVPFALALCVVSPAALAAECGPSFNAGGVDAEAYGASENYPSGTMAQRGEQRFIVGSLTSYDRLQPGPAVAAPPQASPLTRSCEPFKFSYRFDGQQYSLEDYLARHPATGFLIAKGPNILVERYQYGRRDTDRFVSQSVAKTITAMLFGIAVKDGKIRSLDDRAQDYVPDLKGSAYGETSLRALLTMSSGVAWSETYGPGDDISKFGRDLFRPNMPGAAVLLRGYNSREVPEGTRFRYASSETEVLGLVLAAATGKRLTDYASTRLWKPMGAEADATWSADRKGDILGFCCFSARLRDFARFGLLLANDGGGIIPQVLGDRGHLGTRGLLARPAQGDAVLWLWLPDLADAGWTHVRSARHSRPGDLRRSGLEAGAGAHRRARSAFGRSGRAGAVGALVCAGRAATAADRAR